MLGVIDRHSTTLIQKYQVQHPPHLSSCPRQCLRRPGAQQQPHHPDPTGQDGRGTRDEGRGGAPPSARCSGGSGGGCLLLLLLAGGVGADLLLEDAVEVVQAYNFVRVLYTDGSGGASTAIITVSTMNAKE